MRPITPEELTGPVVLHRTVRRHFGRCVDCGARFQRRAPKMLRCVRCRTRCREARRKMGEYVPMLGPPRCACGCREEYGSDPLTGRSIVWCACCGERALPVYGVRRYDQEREVEEVAPGVSHGL